MRAQIKRRPIAKSVGASAFTQFGCREVSYNLDIPIGSFKTKAFLKALGVNATERWSALLLPTHQASGYHVHFRGHIDRKFVHLTIDYCAGAKKSAPAEELEPFAESVMPWLGALINGASWRAQAMVLFNKPIATWRSRFNLPVKVTMLDSEVVVDGVSLRFPRNPFHAASGFVARDETRLFVALQVIRPIEFANFDVSEEIASFNQALSMFIEEVAS